MLSIFVAMLVVVNGQSCLRTNNANGLPPFMDYRGSDLRSDTIPELQQVIIPSYRFTCCGNITEWGVDVHPGGANDDMIYTLNFQVWRPSLNVETTGCYSLVGENMFTSVPLTNQVAVVSPLPEERIQFQPGDVLGFMLENPDGSDGGVVLLIDSPEQGDNDYETEEVWHTDTSMAVIGDLLCPYPVGTGPGRILNSRTNAAPVISISYGSTSCPPNIIPIPSQPILTEISLSALTVTNLSEVTDPQTETEDTFPNNSSDSLSKHNNIGLIIGIR